MKLGLRQGLAKGLAICCNGVVFAIWSVMSYYESRLVMYHSAQGDTVLSVGSTLFLVDCKHFFLFFFLRYEFLDVFVSI